ncbi:hypothetical protein BUALT_Bualt07G0056100 [Buddleja alternifolia]|uniref:Uncharacterized protein n=1 Tax=Buddleja alternifolia TaxID=168488 RepID=A0AAV6XG67_9LAMI|nr:hypothetical protein BUALT_Bualt07G0056100 [Buddleja alternifolia]
MYLMRFLIKFTWHLNYDDDSVSVYLVSIYVCAAVSLHSHATSVTVINGLHFSERCEQVNFHLGVLDLDLALFEEKPADITDEGSDTEKLKCKAWDRLCMSFMRMTIVNNIKTTLPESVTAKEYLKLVEEHFRSADKSLAGTLMAELTTMNKLTQEEMRLKAQGGHTINLLGQGASKVFKPKSKKFKKKRPVKVPQVTNGIPYNPEHRPE